MLDKKKIKRDYKEKIRPAGVYVVINKNDKKIFIGKTRTPSSVLYRLNIELERGTHPHKNMINDYEKLGKNNFEIKIYSELNIEKLEESEVVEKLNELYESSREELNNDNYTFYNFRPGH